MHKMKIPFNIPYISGEERYMIENVFERKEFSGNSLYSRQCEDLFQQKFNFTDSFLTHSGTSSLEFAASLCNFKPGDEVILPSFGYLTVASAFLSKGAKLVFADSEIAKPHICPLSIAQKITKKTKAIIVIHYGGVNCNMMDILALAAQHNLIVIEDCAHAINAINEGKYLGSEGHLSIFSFHETKNIHCGEGGLLVVNEKDWVNKAQKIWQEGSNRNEFDQGFVNRYQWVEMGSSYQPSELNASFLFAQLKFVEAVTKKRKDLWENYYNQLNVLTLTKGFQLPNAQVGHNAHIFYIKCPHIKQRNELIHLLVKNNIQATFHYQPLHLSPFYLKNNPIASLPNSEFWADTIIRLPIFYDLTNEDQEKIIEIVTSFISLM